MQKLSSTGWLAHVPWAEKMAERIDAAYREGVALQPETAEVREPR